MAGGKLGFKVFWKKNNITPSLRIGTCRYCNNPRNLEGAEK
jgi:hypothetical protein